MFPTDEEYNLSEAKKLIESLMKKFSIQEQSEMVHQMHRELISKRKSQIEDTEKELSSLKTDLEKLTSFHI